MIMSLRAHGTGGGGTLTAGMVATHDMPAIQTVSVVIPTYRRPDFLERCVASLALHERRPDEVVIVSRDSDQPTNERIEDLKRKFGNTLRLIHGLVFTPGFVPPIRKGIELAQGEIVAFIDDDAEAFPDWLGRLLEGYSSSTVGGVGGRVINIVDGIPAAYPVAHVVGKLYWYGREVGNLYRDVSFENPRDVDFLSGGNMSYRRRVLQRITIDPALEKNVAFYWELDVGLQVKQLGFRVLYDPKIRVNHFTALREVEGMRTVNPEGRFWSNYNYSYLMMKYLSPIGRLAYIFYSLVIGGTSSGGIVYVMYRILTGRGMDWKRDLWPSLNGRVQGAMAYWRGSYTRSGEGSARLGE